MVSGALGMIWSNARDMAHFTPDQPRRLGWALSGEEAGGQAGQVTREGLLYHRQVRMGGIKGGG